jgi:hypothetical protein
MQPLPIVCDHLGIKVVRDDLFPGGTKARFIPKLFENADEVVYAGPCEGGAQVALAVVANALGKRATLFVAERASRHARTEKARSLGATVFEVKPGYLSVVKARAFEYCRNTGALLARFGMPGAIDCIADAAMSTGVYPDEVWCAGGSGVLARSLRKAWPKAIINAVQVGRTLEPSDVDGAKIHLSGVPFGKAEKIRPPFDSCQYYDAKAWRICIERKGPGEVLFWNVTGAA